MKEDIENVTWEHSTYSDSCRMAVVYTDYVDPVLMQVRKHKKKRINKKWLKRYGMHHINLAKGEFIGSYDVIDGEWVWTDYKG